MTLGRDASGPIVLANVKGNFPALLWGREGRLIQSQQELELALTQLRWLGSGLVAAAHTCLLLPCMSKVNPGFITELGLAIQIEDPCGAIFRASRCFVVKDSREPPRFTSNRAILDSPQVTWTITTRGDASGDAESSCTA